MDLQSKSVDSFLYDRGLCHERLKKKNKIEKMGKR